MMSDLEVAVLERRKLFFKILGLLSSGIIRSGLYIF